jgi:signal transduction histidine kinase
MRVEPAFAGASLAMRGEFPWVDGDDVLLRQVLHNLLRNAQEACAGAGVTPDIVVEGAIDGDRQSVRLTVIDNGPGVEASARDRVFQPFFTTKNRGTGLGLSIVQKVIVTHNGRVQIGAAPGGGASVQLVLPARQPMAGFRTDA